MDFRIAGIIQNLFSKFYIDTYSLIRLTAEETGLSCDIWIDSSRCKRTHDEQSYIWIRRKNRWKKVLLSNRKEGYHELHLWLDNNKEVIERHWRGELSDIEMLNTLERKIDELQIRSS